MPVPLIDKSKRIAVSLSCIVVIAACTPPPEEVITTIEGEPPTTSGLEERLPDTCNLSSYESYVGQPLAAAAIPTNADTRIVRSNSILSQVYESARVNFHVDDAGVITKVICG